MEEKPPPQSSEETFGAALTSLNAFTPDLAAIRETLKALESKGMDPREAYLHLTSTRPKEWPPLPSFGELMGE